MRIPPPPSKPKMNDISKRYWTAVMIAQGMMANPRSTEIDSLNIIELAYKWADALLEQEDK